MSKNNFDIHSQMTSWQFIIQSNLRHLPIDLHGLCELYGIDIIKYSDYSTRIRRSIDYITYKYGTNGFCLFSEGQYYIVVNSFFLNETNLKYTIAHELGHIVLGHIGPDLPFLDLTHDIKNLPAEQQAEKFAYRLLCPSIVLHLCGASSPAEVAEICAVDPDVAALRWDHLQELRKIKRFLQVPEEREVMNQFASFISNYIADKFNKDG